MTLRPVLIMPKALPFAAIIVDRMIAGVIIFCIALNALAPRVNLEGQERLLSTAIKSQSSVLHFFCLPTMSVKLAALLMGQKAPSAARKTAHPAGKVPQKHNSASEYFLFSAEKRHALERFCTFEGGIAVLPWILRLPGINYAKDICRDRCAAVGIPVFLLYMFSMLPRGNIDGEGGAMIISNRAILLPSLNVKLGFSFYMPLPTAIDHTLPRRAL